MYTQIQGKMKWTVLGRIMERQEREREREREKKREEQQEVEARQRLSSLDQT